MRFIYSKIFKILPRYVLTCGLRKVSDPAATRILDFTKNSDPIILSRPPPNDFKEIPHIVFFSLLTWRMFL